MAGSVHGAGRGARKTGRTDGGCVGAGWISASEVTVQAVAYVRDGFALQQLHRPQILTNDVVGDLFDVPLRAWSRRGPLLRAHRVDNGPSCFHRPDVQITHVRHRSPDYLPVGKLSSVHFVESGE